MRISLVIPFYNAMPLLEELLTSIYRNMEEVKDPYCFEFIFIDDGSTDDYMQVLDSFSKKFPLVQLISQENSGVANARNKGIIAATGDYIWFVDADDYVEDHAFVNIIESMGRFYYQNYILEKLETTELPDIVFCDCKGYDDINNYYHRFNYKYSAFMNDIHYIKSEEDRSEIYDILFGKIKINYAIWYQLFKREMLIHNHLFFDTELKVSEDMDFKFLTLSHAQSVMGAEICIYIYRIPNDNRKSLSKSEISGGQAILLCNMHSHWYEKFKNLSTLMTSETSGYHLMTKKFALLVYSAYKILLMNKNCEAVQDYLSANEQYLKTVYEENKTYLDRVVSEIKKGNYQEI